MSCGPSTAHPTRALSQRRLEVVASEGFRLFFPLAAIYAGLWPLLWVFAHGFDLPLAQTVPPSLWHGHEMLIGAYGAALIGFLTTAAPEWTDTDPMRGRPLWILAALWALGRVAGLLGWEGIGVASAAADLLWLVALLSYLGRLSWRRKTDRLLAFGLWLAALIAATAMTRICFALGRIDWAQTGLLLIGLAFLGLLGLALARITVPVTNLVLDPTERTSPFRPHPGRLHLAPGLVGVVMLGELAGLSPSVSGFLFIAAGAAFLDRVAEAFIGREVLRAEILLLAGSSALAGGGLLLVGAARLGADWPATTGLHVAFMGGLGLGVYAVFCIAGLLHTGRPLRLPLMARVGAVCLVLSLALRVLPELGLWEAIPYLTLSAPLWALAFGLWLASYLPLFMARPVP